MLHVGIDIGGTFTDLFGWDPETRQPGHTSEANPR
jgi:N-methylhydantoinase A/oxoprolinase/acetone carboxylase beta subunit